MTDTIDEGARRVLDMGKAANSRPFERGSPGEARRDFDRGSAKLRGALEPVASVADRVIQGPNGTIGLRIYRGVGAETQAGPALLYLHGGGWVIGNLESHDDICRWFANSAACTVVCPDYRLAPEHKFPAGLDDCVATLAFMADEADALGIDRNRIAVAGDSAGGNLAAVVALMSRDGTAPGVSAQLLLYPNTDAAQTADSYRRYGDGFGLTSETMRWFRDHYIRTSGDIEDWRVSPLRVQSLAGAAPAFVAIAGLDILADEGTAYAERLSYDGVPVVLRHFPTQIHGFISMGGYIPAAREAVDDAISAWRSLERPV